MISRLYNLSNNKFLKSILGGLGATVMSGFLFACAGNPSKQVTRIPKKDLTVVKSLEYNRDKDRFEVELNVAKPSKAEGDYTPARMISSNNKNCRAGDIINKDGNYTVSFDPKCIEPGINTVRASIIDKDKYIEGKRVVKDIDFTISEEIIKEREIAQSSKTKVKPSQEDKFRFRPHIGGGAIFGENGSTGAFFAGVTADAKVYETKKNTKFYAGINLTIPGAETNSEPQKSTESRQRENIGFGYSEQREDTKETTNKTEYKLGVGVTGSVAPYSWFEASLTAGIGFTENTETTEPKNSTITYFGPDGSELEKAVIKNDGSSTSDSEDITDFYGKATTTFRPTWWDCGKYIGLNLSGGVINGAGFGYASLESSF